MSSKMINFEKFRTGVDWMDKQHFELIDMTLDLISAIDNGGGERKLGGMLEFLDRYVAVHFSLEDALLKNLDYPERHYHLAEHKNFIYSLDNMKKELRSVGPSIYLSGNVKRHLLDWLVNHIGETDMGFARFLIDNNIEEPEIELPSKSTSAFNSKVNKEIKYCG